MGHTIINADGGTARRSLEDLASRAAIGITLARRIRTNHPSTIKDFADASKMFVRVRSSALAEAYRTGDAEVVGIVNEAARYVGSALANAVMLLGLPLVVLGGGLVEAIGEPFVDLAAKQMRSELFPEDMAVKVVSAALGDDAVMLGAVGLARAAAAK